MIISEVMKMFNQKYFFSVLVLTLCVGNIVSTNGLSFTADRESRKLFGGYRITPKFCNATRSLLRENSHGPTICMFNHECTQRNGEVVGACMDGFLFGTCCQLSGMFEQPLVKPGSNMPASNSATALSYEKYGNDNNDYQSVTKDVTKNKFTNSYGEAIDVDSDLLSTEFESNNKYGHNTGELITINSYTKSPSYTKFSDDDEAFISASYFPSSTDSNKNGEMYLPPSTSQSYSPEVPSLLSSYNKYSEPSSSSTEANDFTSDGIHYIANTFLQDKDAQQPLFDHSDITHPEVDSVLLQDSDNEIESTGYGGQPQIVQEVTRPRPRPTTSPKPEKSTTLKTQKVTPPKIQFKPKPTKTEPFILVPTLTNVKNVTDRVSTVVYTSSTGGPIADNESHLSIESILLMLNDTKLGPQYETHTEHDEANYDYDTNTAGDENSEEPSSTSTVSYPSTTMINYDKYGSTSFYITTKVPSKAPLSSPNYIYSSYGSSSTAVPSSSVLPPISSSYSDEEYTSSNKVVLSSSTLSTTVKAPLPTVSNITAHTPSTSYVYSPNPTKRPQTTVTLSKVPPTKKVIITPKPPKIPDYTTVAASSTYRPINHYNNNNNNNNINNNKNKLPEYTIQSYPIDELPEYTIQSHPLNNENYVKISAVSITENPSGTVHITPKPAVTLVTSSSWNKPKQPNGPTFNIVHQSTIRPQIIYTSTQSSNFDPTYNSDSDESVSNIGYYGVTKRPAGQPGFEHTVTSTSIYTIQDGGLITSNKYSPRPPPSYSSGGGHINNYNGQSTPTFQSAYNPSAISEASSAEISNQNDEFSSSPDDMNSFPPVRNPNLNMSAPGMFGNQSYDDKDLVTPTFLEDGALNSKMDLLVSKIVASLQGNFGDLADMVEKRRNVTIVRDELPQNNTTSVVTKKPITTRKPGNTRVTTTKKPRPITSKPGSARPATGAITTKPSADEIIKPTSSRPSGNRPAVAKPNSSKKPPTTSKTTKKTVTSKKPVAKLTTTTKKPTITKPTKKIIPSTTPLKDEISEEDEESTEEEEDDDVGEENETVSTTQQALATGKIQCGVRPQYKSGRIVGGKASSFGEWPWQVLVKEATWLGLFTKNKCGGVLISNSYVLTAAHCQPGFLATLVALFGEYDISGELESKRSVSKNVKRVVVHRQYDAATFENDLALLELESPIHYDAHIVPICLPPDEKDFTHKRATVTGWGRLKYGGGVPSILQEVEVPVIENSVCQEMFHAAKHEKKILPSFLCAGYATGQKDSCEGDSGGPLVLQRPDGRYELVGTVSHGIKCAAPLLPGVYMRTTYYKPWLKSVTGVK